MVLHPRRYSLTRRWDVQSLETVDRLLTHPSNLSATAYTTQTSAEMPRPTGDSYRIAEPRKASVEPTYIGSERTLNGKPVTREDMRMPK